MKFRRSKLTSSRVTSRPQGSVNRPSLRSRPRCATPSTLQRKREFAGCQSSTGNSRVLHHAIRETRIAPNRYPMAGADTMPVTQEEVYAALKQCYGPEIPVNIVDLGLIYEVRVKPTAVANATGEDVEVEMTLTAQGGPSSGQITDDVKRRLLSVPGVPTPASKLCGIRSGPQNA